MPLSRPASANVIPTDLRAMLRRVDRPILVAVAGDSGSGKTTYTQGIVRLLGRDLVSSLSLDGYHKEDRSQRLRSGRSPLDPRANHIGLVRDHLERLRCGDSVDCPVYDHHSGTFAATERFQPKPVIIVEGLHALYPEFLPSMDFRLYMDTDSAVKQRWKFNRDVFRRGYDPAQAREQMDQREADYRRWIDFQKTNADVVIRIHESELASLAIDEYQGRLPEDCHHMEVIVTPTEVPLPSLHMPVDMNNMTRHQTMPFMLANVPSSFWGKPVNVVHIDGVMPAEAMGELEGEIRRLSGIRMDSVARDHASSPSSNILFTQLLVAWPFIGHLLASLHNRGSHSGAMRAGA